MEIVERKAKIQKWASIGLIGLAGLIVSPIIFLAVQGLVGLVIAGLVGLSVITFTPWVAMKFANWKVKAIAHEARENPIETMVNLLASKREAYERFNENVINAVTASKDFANKCAQFGKQYPARAEEFNKQLAAMQMLVNQKVQTLKAAKQSLEDADHKLTEMRAYWDMSQAAQAANQAAGMDTGDMYEQLKADTAVDAVFESVNRAFAQLEVAAAIDTPQQIAYNSSTTLEFTNVNVQEKVRV